MPSVICVVNGLTSTPFAANLPWAIVSAAGI
ncbi:MAG: hypothetical protein V7637_5383, partial [Mycobacteriales bacterium]